MNNKEEVDWLFALRTKLKHAGEDYVGFRKRILKYRTEFHQELALAIGPILTEELRTRPQQNYHEKRDLAVWLNREA